MVSSEPLGLRRLRQIEIRASLGVETDENMTCNRLDQQLIESEKEEKEREMSGETKIRI